MTTMKTTTPKPLPKSTPTQQSSTTKMVAGDDQPVPCQPCWSGKHHDCYNPPGFNCLCSANGHPPGPCRIPDYNEDAER